MTAGAKVSVFALLAVALLGWGLVATTPRPEPPAAAAPAPEAATEPEPEPEPEAEAEPEATPARAALPAAPKPPPAPAAPPPAPPGPGELDDPERGSHVVEVDHVADAYAERERQIERNVQRYDAAQVRFADEPRDEAWAAEHEQVLKQQVEEAGIGDLLEGVQCKSSLCQMRVRFNGLTAAGAAVRLGPLARAMGPDRVLRNEGPPDQRTMVIYMPRDGRWPDTPSENPALDGK